MPAKSKAQQRFAGMVRATQKGEMSSPSKAVADAAESMTASDAKDFAKTKHDGLPEKKKPETKSGDNKRSEKESAFVRGMLSAFFEKAAADAPPAKQQQLKDFLQITPDTEDAAIHQFAGEIDMDPDEAETEIYDIAKEHLGDRQDDPMEKLKGGEADDNKPEAGDDEAGAGIAVEMEHTDDPEIAKEISEDHLAEDRDYYSKLKAMEAGGCDDIKPSSPYDSAEADDLTDKEAAFLVGLSDAFNDRGVSADNIMELING